MKGPDYTLDHDEVDYGKYKHPDGSIQSSPYEESFPELSWEELKVKEEIGIRKRQLEILKEFWILENYINEMKEE